MKEQTFDLGCTGIIWSLGRAGRVLRERERTRFQVNNQGMSHGQRDNDIEPRVETKGLGSRSNQKCMHLSIGSWLFHTNLFLGNVRFYFDCGMKLFGSSVSGNLNLRQNNQTCLEKNNFLKWQKIYGLWFHVHLKKLYCNFRFLIFQNFHKKVRNL